MKNKFNTLHKYIFEHSTKEYRKETINGLFRMMLEPLISNQKVESCILMRINDIEEKSSSIKRLTFSKAKIYSYNDKLIDYGLEDSMIQDIWGNTEFLIILAQRYSVALLWDYSLADTKGVSPTCVLYNSKIVSDISKKILENSCFDFKELLIKYAPDRRENLILNQSINSIISLLNDKNEEILFAEQEKKHLVSSDDTLKTAEVIADKAKFIAHEIKNNLSIINLYSKIAEKRFNSLETPEEVKQSVNNSLNNIATASENVSSLISDLRCLSAPYKTELSIKNIVLNTVLMCEEKANKAGVNIAVAEFEDCIVTTDKTKLQCSITNLIFNAIEACKEGCLIGIDCFIEPKEIRIFVKNNGEVIPKEIQDKIFEIDFTTKEKGNGIGLAMCKKQMQLVNADINLVHSNKVETLFEIVLTR